MAAVILCPSYGLLWVCFPSWQSGLFPLVHDRYDGDNDGDSDDDADDDANDDDAKQGTNGGLIAQPREEKEEAS